LKAVKARSIKHKKQRKARPNFNIDDLNGDSPIFLCKSNKIFANGCFQRIFANPE